MDGDGRRGVWVSQGRQMSGTSWLRTLEQRVNPQTAALIILDMLKASPEAPPSMEIPRIKGRFSI
jgi:hypothetical protein